MKILITESQYKLLKESKLIETITNYFNELFDVDNIKWEHPYDHDEDSGEDYEDTNRIAFYIDNANLSDTEHCFKWYDCEYFNPGSHAQTICPTVDIETHYVKILNGYFGNIWIEPFKEWFKTKFNLPVKTVEWF